MEERLRKQLAFALEIDKEKNIFRQTHLSGHGRKENDAEHAWHMAIMAWLLREYSNEQVDIARVMLMCLIHDIVEIDAGDTYAYDSEGLATQKAREDAAKERIFSLLPEDQKHTLIDLFDEFEACETAESRYAHAMDNLQPLLLNDSNGGGDWREHNVSAAQVYGRQKKTRMGSETLYQVTDRILKKNIAMGNLRPFPEEGASADQAESISADQAESASADQAESASADQAESASADQAESASADQAESAFTISEKKPGGNRELAAGSMESPAEAKEKLAAELETPVKTMDFPFEPPCGAAQALSELRSTVAKLRAPDGCPWDRRQTHESLKPACVEEAAEVVSGINILTETGRPESLCEELGDLLLQVMMHAQIAEEEGLFTLEDVIRGIDRKMIRRHPHIFGSGADGTNPAPGQDRAEEADAWRRIKAAEKEGREWESAYLFNAFTEAEQLIDVARERKKE